MPCKNDAATLTPKELALLIACLQTVRNTSVESIGFTEHSARVNGNNKIITYKYF